jgi:hypothetical protein
MLCVTCAAGCACTPSLPSRPPWSRVPKLTPHPPPLTACHAVVSYIKTSSLSQQQASLSAQPRDAPQTVTQQDYTGKRGEAYVPTSRYQGGRIAATKLHYPPIMVDDSIIGPTQSTYGQSFAEVGEVASEVVGLAVAQPLEFGPPARWTSPDTHPTPAYPFCDMQPLAKPGAHGAGGEPQRCVQSPVCW